MKSVLVDTINTIGTKSWILNELDIKIKTNWD